LFLLLSGGRLAQELKTYQTLSWLNLAAWLGTLTSLPFAPPWDGETRIFAATLPLFFLLPASGAGGLYLLIATRFHKVSPESKANTYPNTAIGAAVIIGATVTLVITSASWFLIDHSALAKNRWHPVARMIEDFIAGNVSKGPFDLSSLHVGYRLRVIDDSQATWLPGISRKDFIRNTPRGAYASLSPRFKQLPSDAEIIVLPYWVLFALDKEDARTQTFTPLPEQTGHVVWPPVYFSKLLRVEAR